MQWKKTFYYTDEYEYVSSNQHGERYKKKGRMKKHTIAKLSCDCTDTNDMKTLILLGNGLDLPVRYDFKADPQEAFIEVIGKEAL